MRPSAISNWSVKATASGGGTSRNLGGRTQSIIDARHRIVNEDHGRQIGISGEPTDTVQGLLAAGAAFAIAIEAQSTGLADVIAIL